MFASFEWGVIWWVWWVVVYCTIGEKISNFPLIVMQPRWWPQGPWWHPDTWSQVRCQVTIYTMCIFVCGHNIYLSSPLVTDTLINGWSHENINTGYQYQHIHDLVHGSKVWFMWLLLSMNKCVYKGIHLFECWIIFPNIWLVSSWVMEERYPQ